MAEVAFHFNAADKLDYTCRLLRKAYLKGARCQVLAPDDDLRALNALLWTRVAGDFLPHSTDTDPESLRRRSPLHLGHLAPAGVSVVVFLGDGEPSSGLPEAERIIEVVATDLADRERARVRWRWYRDQGIEPIRHDLMAS